MTLTLYPQSLTVCPWKCMIGRLGVWHQKHMFFWRSAAVTMIPKCVHVCVYIPLIIDVTYHGSMEYPTLKQLNPLFALSFQEAKVFLQEIHHIKRPQKWVFRCWFQTFSIFHPKTLGTDSPCSYEWFNSFEASGCWTTLHPVCFQGWENARKITKWCLVTRIAKVIKY